jgi:hypothetical protein
MYRLDFDTLYSYATEPVGISVPVALKSGDKRVRLAASIDTGAAYCLFRAELAPALGLDLTNGELKRFRTANSNFDAYGHEVELSVLGSTTFSRVYFFADAAINKNVLGRVGWLDRVRLGLVEHDSHVYLAPYNQS